MNARALFLACVLAQATVFCRAADMSPELTALVHDILQPYAATAPADASENTKNAAEILRKAHLAGAGRPSTVSNVLLERYAKTFALGTRISQFIPEIMAIHEAFQGGNSDAVRDAIRVLSQHAGRAAPDDTILFGMVEQLQDAENAGGKKIERVSLEQPDQSIQIMWSKPTGKVKIDVINRKGPDGQPVRTTFTGEAQTKADSTGKALDLIGKPDNKKPREITQDQARKLREKINGDWMDQDRNVWILTGSDASVTATKDQAGHKVEYKAKYDLGKLTGEHLVSDPLDVTEPFPAGVKEQLASKFHPPYKIDLDVNDEVDKLEGTWISMDVTYSGLTGEVESVQDPYDVPLVLTRKSNAIRILLTDRDFKPISEIPVYVIPRDGSGGGEVWVEVQVPRADKDFDDGKIDSITIHLKSDSDPAGVDVICEETSASSRVFRSKEAVDLYPVTENVTP